MPTTFRSTFSLALIMCFRMLGLFMILPVFAPLVAHMGAGASGRMIGLALGVYGLTQAALQIPFAMASDKFGRKPLIIIGLILFATGSVFAARAHTLPMLIIGRALQGSGAVGSTLLAMLADLTPDESRTKSMALMGMSIGLSFALAMVLGPLVSAHFGLSGIFWLTAILAIVAILIVLLVVPTPTKLLVHQDVETLPGQLRKTLTRPALLSLDFGIFSLHAIMTAMFIALPHVLGDLHLSMHAQTIFYLLVLVAAFVLMTPGVIIAETKHKLKFMMALAIILIAVSQLLLLFNVASLAMVVVALVVFFTAFTLLESTLPSLVSKVAPLRNKGTAMGIYSTSQFLGIFLGGVLGGIAWQYYSISGVAILCAVWAVVWLFLLLRIPEPPYTSTWIIKLADNAAKLNPKTVCAIAGVYDCLYLANENMVVVKVDKHLITKPQLRKRLEAGNL